MHRERHAPLEECEWKQGECAVATDSRLKKGPVDLDPPFPFPRWGKPGREGSPHAAKTRRLPPQEGQAPLVRSPKDVSAFVLDIGRPSHGSGERSDP